MVNEGDKVEENQKIAIIEAMKMETNITAKSTGEISKIYVEEGQMVEAGELLISLK